MGRQWILFPLLVSVLAGAAEVRTDSFIGCLVDNDVDLLLSGHFERLYTDSPGKCKKLCYSLGFLYAGLKHSNQCFCGDTPPPPEYMTDSPQCATDCEEKASIKSSRNNNIAVYGTDITDIPILGLKIGCFHNREPKLFREYITELSMTNSPRRCVNLCRSLGYQYAGVEDSVECHCGNIIHTNNLRDLGDQDCSSPCPGNPLSTCGARGRIQVYRTGLSDLEPVAKKVECFTAEDSSPGQDYRWSVRHSTTQTSSSQGCVKQCFSKGFPYSSFFDRACWCADVVSPGAKDGLIESSADDAARIAAAKCGNGKIPLLEAINVAPVTKPWEESFLGCYKDKGDRLLPNHHEDLLNLTPLRCRRLCQSLGYPYSGVEFRIQCFCADNPYLPLQPLDISECNMKCAGNASIMCGGLWRISVYKTDAQALEAGAWKEQFVGCYKDAVDRLLPNHHEVVSQLTPFHCIGLCRRLGYLYSGVELSVYCYCSDNPALPPHPQDPSECNLKCGGSSSKCGGVWRISVYKTGAQEEKPRARLARHHNQYSGRKSAHPRPSLSTSRRSFQEISSHLEQEYIQAGSTKSWEDSFLGCYKDSGDRLLSDYFKILPLLTPRQCIRLCEGMGYPYSGVEFSTSCFCSDNPALPPHPQDLSECNMKCGGNATLKCGGLWRISVYKTNVKDSRAPSASLKVDCIDNKDTIVLQDYEIQLMTSNTPRWCANLCRSLGYEYTGIEHRVECYCGNDQRSNSSRSECCSSLCPGQEVGSFRHDWSDDIDVRGDYSDPEPSVKEADCFTEVNSYSQLHYRWRIRHDFGHSMCPQTCVNFCYEKGYNHSTFINSVCWCADKVSLRPTAGLAQRKQANSVECERGQIALLEITNFVPQMKLAENYIGCLHYERHDCALGGVMETSEQLTPEKCMEFCFSKGFRYFATKNKNQCHCGDMNPYEIFNSALDKGMECSLPCSGDNHKHCGGTSALSAYSTGIPDVAETDKLIGCFQDDRWPRLLTEHKTDLDVRTSSPRRCLNYCLHLGYLYAGVSFQRECSCGNSRPKAMQEVPASQCDSTCSGDSSKTCGGVKRVQVYRTGLSTTDIPGTPCELSETLVNGKPACRGSVVFFDSFDSTSLSSQWKHEIKIPDAPDYEFATFTSDNTNSYLEDGHLVIKPTVMSAEQVETGSLVLEGCTGVPNTRECQLQAFSFNILPPVKSARVSTRDSFSFRYGIVEIRARLPAGDWLVPELWLLSKDHVYGESYLSGKIKVALSRGNRYLSCGETDMSSTKLESGVFVGPEKKITSHLVSNRLAGGWNQQAHNFTLLWTPETISFYVDGQDRKSVLLPGSRLSDLMGFNGDTASTWSNGSNIAPFDADFYLSLGLSAGGSRDFPDGCLSNSEEKPWTNFKVKGLLNFWLSKESWLPSWQEDTSSLLVEHVRVTAL